MAESELSKHTPVCGIGASAGGVAALKSFFGNVKPDLGLAYVVVTHLEPTRPTQMPAILGQCTEMPIEEVSESTKLAPNRVYMIPPNRKLVIDGDNLEARPFDEPRGQRAPIDLLFRSLASGRPDGLAVILSGSGSDGAVGVRAVKENGGVIFVQDPGEAEYAMMPRSAIATGAADFVAPVESLVERIAEVASSREALAGLDQKKASDELRQILAFLRARTGHDFSNYKRATMMRRVTRRMQVTRKSSLAAYRDHLRDHPEEVGRLFDDLLISVTMFFRDPEAYQILASEVIPALFEDVGSDGEIRAWVVGCATGEEAYSLAILFLEEADRRKTYPRIQIFATDLDEGALATAREGRYPASIQADVSDERLQRFFIQEDSHYRVRSEIRDLVLFAPHNAVRDPPFLRLNLVSCRNLMIYLERELQRELCAVLHYALVPGGFLFLGSAETADNAPELFRVAHREHCIFRARASAARSLPTLQHLPGHAAPPERERPPPRRQEPDHGVAAVHRAALEQASPPSVLVDSEQRVVHLSESAGRFIMPPKGPFTAELAAIVRPELRLDLQGALHRAFDHGQPTITFPVAVVFDDVRRRVMIHVAPLSRGEHEAPRALVVFLDGGEIDGTEDEEAPTGAEKPGATEQLRRLQEALRLAHERLAASRREHHVATEELKAANEELQSINEEYRSTSEELETSKEELQSMNEELQAVNDELKRKLESISTAHSDLQNLVTATELGTLFLDPELRIKLFTPKVTELFNVREGDIGRAITSFTHKLRYEGIERDAAAVLRDLTPIEREVSASDGRWLLMRVRPYRTIEDRIDGIVVSFIDITERRQAEEGLRERDRRLQSVLEAAGVVAIEWNADDDGLYVEGPVAEVIPALSASSLTSIRDVLASAHRDDRERAEAELREAAKGPDGFYVEFRCLSEDDELRWLRIDGSRAADDGGKRRVLGTIQDITDLKQAEESQRLLVAELNHRVKNMLAVVQSIARQTERTSATTTDFAEAFEQRLAALSAAHDLLTRETWRGTSMRRLLKATLSSFTSDEEKARRISIAGPRVRLSPSAALSLAIAFHELGTNALKYGALSVPEGQVEVSWRLDDGEDDGEPGQLRVTWAERQGPTVAPPTRRGFGSQILGEALAYELAGTIRLDYARSGLICTMEFPLDGSIQPA